jgi:BirA family biotin operon repressor/biotin-[acetyl-CoA-carboxylase] ligase
MNGSNKYFNNILYLESIDSTNNYLKEGNFEDRTIVFTFDQTKGRGRDHKLWKDFNGKNIAISFQIKPERIFKNNIWYIATSSLALIDILIKYNIKNCWIKWPNDIYIKKDKLAGILAESVWISDKLTKLIIGIGININCTKEDLCSLDNRATSFYIQKKMNFEMHDFFYSYKEQLSKWLLLLEKDGISEIREKWCRYCKILNKNVEWIKDGKKINGRIIDIEKDGGLIFKSKNILEKIISGEVNVK